LDRLPNARRLRPFLHDINDMLVQGWDIRAWVTASIEEQEETELIISDLCADCHTSIEADACALSCSVCGADIERYDENGSAYCSEHYPQLQPTQADDLAQLPEMPALRPEENPVVLFAAKLFHATVHRDPIDFTIQNRAREIAKEDLERQRLQRFVNQKKVQA
jgi:hypothetical protein